jgi:hypothetical protein
MAYVVYVEDVKDKEGTEDIEDAGKEAKDVVLRLSRW